MLRTLCFAAAYSLASALAAPAQERYEPEIGYVRPGGDFAYVTMPTPESCAQACAGDGLCLAWTYRLADQTCRLKAVAPDPVAEPGAVSGVSRRAPADVLRPPRPAAPPPPASSPAHSPMSQPLPLAIRGGDDPGRDDSGAVDAVTDAPGAPPLPDPVLLGGPDEPSYRR